MATKAKQLWTAERHLVPSTILSCRLAALLAFVFVHAAVLATEANCDRGFRFRKPEYAINTGIKYPGTALSETFFSVEANGTSESELPETIIRSQASFFRTDRIILPFRFPTRAFDGIRYPGEDLSCSWKRTRMRTWVRGYGTWNDLGTFDSVGGQEVSSFGMALGLDQQFGRNLLLGIALGGNRSRFQHKNYGDNENLSAFFATAFARSTFQRLFFDIEGGFGRNESLSRGNLSGKNDWKTQWHFKGEIGTWWSQGLGKVEPYLGIRYTDIETDSSSVDNPATLQAGVRYSWKTVGSFSVFVPRIYGGVLRELGGRDSFSIAPFTDAPTVYWVPGYEIPETRMFFGGGLTSSMGTSLDLYLRYTAEVASGYASHVIWFGMNWCY